MHRRDLVLISDAVATCLSFSTNMVLLVCILKKTTTPLKPYSKILRQNVLVDSFYTFAVIVTFLQVETNEHEYILFMQGPFKNLPHPWNGLLIVFYIFATLFSIFSYSIPLCYRYFLVVKENTMSNSKFYFLYAITAFLAFIIAFGVRTSTTWPGWDPSNGTDFWHSFDDFWRDENGKVPIFAASHLTNPLIYFTVLFAFSIVVLTYMTAGFFCIRTIRHLKRIQDRMEARDQSLQRQITFALIGQAAIPCIVGGFPLVLMFLDWIFYLNIPRIGIISASTLAWTAFLNPFIAIWFILPYRIAVREFIWKYICRRKIVVVNPDDRFGGTTMMEAVSHM